MSAAERLAATCARCEAGGVGGAPEWLVAEATRAVEAFAKADEVYWSTPITEDLSRLALVRDERERAAMRAARAAHSLLAAMGRVAP